MFEDTLLAAEKMLKHSAVDIADLSEAYAYFNSNSEESLLISTSLSLESGQKLFAEATARVKDKRTDDTLKDQLLDVAKALEQQLEATKEQDLKTMTLEAFRLQSEQLVCAAVQCTQSLSRVVGEKMKTELRPHAKTIWIAFIHRVNLILPVAKKFVQTWVVGIEYHEKDDRCARHNRLLGCRSFGMQRVERHGFELDSDLAKAHQRRGGYGEIGLGHRGP